jgi:uncharacterized protein (DUF2062 family)
MMFGRLKSKSIDFICSMIKEGTSTQKVALCLAVGMTLGIFPVLGVSTLLCTLAALFFRLNLPAIQVVNYMVYPLQIALLAPFYGTGSWLFNQERWLAPGESLITLIKTDFWGSLGNLWDLVLYAVFTWMVVCPILIILLYFIFKSVIVSLSSLRQKRYS